MEPTAQQRVDLQGRLDSIIKKIPNFVSIAKSFQERQKVPIDNISDFVLGMIYQNFFQKSIDYNVKYVRELETTYDLSSIMVDIFETDFMRIKELIQKELSRKGII